jgi:hypothetical protein
VHPPAWKRDPDSLSLFDDVLRTLLPEGFELEIDLRTDRLIVRRVYVRAAPKVIEPPPRLKQGELF